ncbi:small ribosomal subunit protein uS11-like [Corticium candelabrum]|uniref:small ribosomal subunit protein uS11-like n=1 Tax=Corticium candelabrum TaxID=121492 RepID=UPI002E25558C|nr:small ribosomal subunit protein uS11-like [Corticium candelabrum]
MNLSGLRAVCSIWRRAETLLQLRVPFPHLQQHHYFSNNLESRISRDREHTFHNLPIAHVHATYNNTIVTVTDSSGKTLNWASGGQQGFKGAKRKTTTAAEAAGVAAAQTAASNGTTRIRVKVKGFGPRGRWLTVQSAVKGLQVGGLDVVSITDVTPVPHNGCKPRKARRV